jgi:hypothetical protein
VDSADYRSAPRSTRPKQAPKLQASNLGKAPAGPGAPHESKASREPTSTVGTYIQCLGAQLLIKCTTSILVYDQSTQIL